MGWGMSNHCICNDSEQVQKPSPTKQVVAACSPIITAVVKSTCGARRMLVSAVILIFLLIAIYWVSLNQPGNPGHHQPENENIPVIRIQPQTSQNNRANTIEQTEEATEG
ncbi:hypothetical protein ACFW04_008457 [Cataglyphis niger]